MTRSPWECTVTADKPVHLGREFNGATGKKILLLRSCRVVGEGGPTTLYCAVQGRPSLALGRFTSTAPLRQLRVLLYGGGGEDPILSCRGGVKGGLVVSGVLLQGAAAQSEMLPAASHSVGVETGQVAADNIAAIADAQSPAVVAIAGAIAATITSQMPPPSETAAPAPESQPRAKRRKAADAEQSRRITTPISRKTLKSGVVVEVLKAGEGLPAVRGRMVTVRHESSLAGGERFDEGELAFRLGMSEVLRGWDEGINGMMRGERRRLLVPSRLAYGLRGLPPKVPPGASLTVDVEMLQC
eukprot:CAMPEP_0117535964 /NCGR_PEP_ID=MMETSP0784-20121206/41205_1 /TAXON_ID=39447 /ORGANISM="" /LENGTH=299 /DNA_ID=CAMNT_0005332505 /DNA_START=18 /DNA_END=917 /DNA_ORIENTATION=+